MKKFMHLFFMNFKVLANGQCLSVKHIKLSQHIINMLDE